MFAIKLYKTNDEPIVVNKTLSNLIDLSGTLKDETSILNPSVLIEHNNIQTLASYNYAQIPVFGRYYFIKDITSFRSALIKIDLAVDVLMSYKTQLLQQTAIISRQQKKYNLYLDDAYFKTYNYSQFSVKKFPNSFISNPNFLLVVAGGRSS